LEDVDQIFVESIFVTLFNYFIDLRAEVGEILEKTTLANEFLVEQARNLCDLVDEVDDGKGDLNNVNVEIAKHPL